MEQTRAPNADLARSRRSAYSLMGGVMSEAQRIEPDMQFKKRLLAAGGETLKKCYQCGACTVACPLSPDREPFPRKELLWAQWGLKDRLLKDGDIWLCHQCNDCSQLCPREANPGDVLAVVRQSAIEHYSTPGLLARLVATPKGLPVLLGVPAVLMLLVIWLTGGFSAQPAEEAHWVADGIFAPADAGGGFKLPVNFDHFFAHYPVTFFFVAFVGLAVLGAIVGLLRFWKDLNAGTAAAGEVGESLGASITGTVKDLLTHKKFKDCDATANRYWGHLLLFYGFAGMVLTTALAAVLYYVASYPFAWYHPVKILGNVSGAVFLVGLGMVLIERLKGGKLAPNSNYSDWLFIVVIGATVLTGIICQVARLAGSAVPAYGWYFVHLLLVFFLLAYLPYSKFAHLLFRTVAYVHARHSGREAEAKTAAPQAAEAPEEAAA